MSEAKLAIRQSVDHQTVIKLCNGSQCGAQEIFIIAGPCAVESSQQMETAAQHLSLIPIQALRGGVHKPRSSPYSFQGLGEEGLTILSLTGAAHNLPVVTEVMSAEQLPSLSAGADILQIGSRNMQNFDLLKAVGGIGKPVLLKRGLAATLEEFLLAAEYILHAGNPQVILCERGIRSFDPFTRNVLDLAAVVALKRLTHLPVIVDPSHASGKHELVAPLSRAAIAAGADGLMIECHPTPDRSISDARQALSLSAMTDLVASLAPIAQAVGRRLAGKPHLSVLSGMSPTKADRLRS